MFTKEEIEENRRKLGEIDWGIPQGSDPEQRAVMDLTNGIREPANDEERKLLKEIKAMERKGFMLDLPLDWRL
ncbi:MAG TPA: hypothetical protein VFC65_13680 [Prolixibacteraceae bacterium]|nr:hypothetical protein [Prolixibacteraceae bacterium]